MSSGKLNLDGIDDYVQFDQHIIPTIGDFSVSFFAQEVSPQTDYTEIISQGFSGGPGFYIGYDPSHDFRIGDDLLGTGIPFPSDGLLHHYAVTAGSDTRLYVDGALVATFDPITTTPDGDDTRLGRQFDPFTEYFDGNVDDLWVFSGTLTASEVARPVAPADNETWIRSSGQWGLEYRNKLDAGHGAPIAPLSMATFASSNVTGVSPHSIRQSTASCLMRARARSR